MIIKEAKGKTLSLALGLSTYVVFDDSPATPLIMETPSISGEPGTVSIRPLDDTKYIATYNGTGMHDWVGVLVAKEILVHHPWAATFDVSSSLVTGYVRVESKNGEGKKMVFDSQQAGIVAFMSDTDYASQFQERLNFEIHPLSQETGAEQAGRWMHEASSRQPNHP